ncbi:MAG TPA: LPS export ABC transporter periplasmic protein LptC [Lutibacter sp.]|nr:LPS export ABC transporter periplasmic protein LptC [Lutibacter sp.]
MFKNKKHIIFKSSVALILATLLFSCTNDIKEVRDYLADKNLPIGISKNIYTVYKDSGMVNTIIRSPLVYDYSNREKHPYSEFPDGIFITKIDINKDSTTVKGNYAISYSKTEISEIKGNVVVTNYSKNYTLYTEQLFWDQNQHYFITEKAFTLITPTDTLYGTGFESSENLSNWQAKNNSGSLSVKE